MSQFIYFTPKEKEAARNADIAEMLMRTGEKLKRSGSEYECGEGSERVTIRGNLWYHQYEQKGGNAVSFVQRFMDKTYVEAMKYILGNGAGEVLQKEPKQSKPKERKTFEPPDLSAEAKRAYAYLNVRRGIPKDVLVPFFKKQLIGKTAYWLYPCIEYACASGMSFLSTDTKGDVMRNYGEIAKEYAYNVSVIDLRNPTKSNGNNLLHLVNKYMDLYKLHPERLAYKAKAEKYAKIISKTIILSGAESSSFGQNAYFYDAAEGILTATILLVAEFCEPQKRHIVSVFKLIQELLAPSEKYGKNRFQELMEMLPDTHKAKWFAGSALNASDQSMASVMSTALSRLNAFLDSELEQILCFDTEIDAEKFCSEKSAVFIIMPEEAPTTFFMISLFIQQLYREILAVADEEGGKLKNRCIFFCDEFGTLPKIQDAEMMFSASRSRRLQIVPIIQSFSQLEKNYGKEGGEIIVDNTQLTIFGGFAPNSTSAEILSKALGTRTVLTGSVSRGRNEPSESLQMTERPLMSADELKAMPKGQFVVMKTGAYPMKVRLKLFFEWGISFGKPYEVKENAERKVEYAERKELTERIIEKYCPDLKSEKTEEPKSSGKAGGQIQAGARRNISSDGRRTDRPFLRTSVKRQLPFNQR